MERNRSLIKFKNIKNYFSVDYINYVFRKKIMRLKSKIIFNLFILFFSFEILEIKAHNIINGGCKDHCSTFHDNRGDENKIKIFKKDKKLFKEQNSCINNSLCRG